MLDKGIIGMKKQFLVVGIVLIAIFGILPESAYGVEVSLGEPIVGINGNTVTLTCTVSGVENGGAEVSLLVVTKASLVDNDLVPGWGTMDETEIVYVDQMYIAANGIMNCTFTADNKFKHLPLRVYISASDAVSKVFVDDYIYTLGDVNGDGKIDLYDVRLIHYHFRGRTRLVDGAFLAADVDRDGIIRMKDALAVHYFYRGRINSFD